MNLSMSGAYDVDNISISRQLLVTTSTSTTEDLPGIAEQDEMRFSNVIQLKGCENAHLCTPSKVFDVLLAVWYGVQCFALISLNLYIILKFWRQRNVRNRFIKERINTLIVALTLTDLIMAVPIVLTIATLWYGRDDFQKQYYPSVDSPPEPPPLLQLWCDMSSIVFGFSSQLSILIVMLISSLRLTSVMFPLKAHIVLSSRVVKCSLLSSALFVMVLALLPYIHKTRAIYTMDIGICATVSLTKKPLPETEVFLTSTVPFILPLLISLICLVGLCIRMIQLSRVSDSPIRTGRSRQVTQTVTTAVQITGVFVLCYIPFIYDGVNFLLNQYKINTLYSAMVCKNCSTIMYIRHTFKVLLIYLNGVINPFLYGKGIGAVPTRLRHTKSSYKMINVRNVNNDNPDILIDQDEDTE